jgi:hypothetical protein
VLKDIADWLAATPLSLFEQNNAWVIPALQSIHILGIAVVMGSVGMLVLRAFGIAGRSLSAAAVVRGFLPWLWSAIALMLASGVLMVVGEPSRALLNTTFQLKMLLLVPAVVLSGLGARAAVASNASPAAPVALGGTMLLTLALLQWVAITVAGLWIAYLE